jgi:hypothetical protein
MNILWEELTAGPTNHDQLLRVFIPLFAAILLGGLIGLQRVRATKPSGLRTHTLVCLGTTVVLLSCSAAGISPEGASRVIQGIVIGIGFVGAGVWKIFRHDVGILDVDAEVRFDWMREFVPSRLPRNFPFFHTILRQVAFSKFHEVKLPRYRWWCHLRLGSGFAALGSFWTTWCLPTEQ